MKAKPHTIKKSSKRERELQILIGLVECFVKTARPVGSGALQDFGFEDISSATIRNYFAQLEEEGFLTQQHASGGRIPTEKAFRMYANMCADEMERGVSESILMPSIEAMHDIKGAVTFLQNMAASTADLTNTPVFISSPRFDRDFVSDVRLISIDHARCLCIILTNFGLVLPEIVSVSQKLGLHSTKRIEDYFQARLKNQEVDGVAFTEEEGQLAHTLYHEIMTRYLVTYSNFSQEDMFKAGFSKLLSYPEFQEAPLLAASLGIFENPVAQRALVRECMKANTMRILMGDDLLPYCLTAPNCAVIMHPYRIGQKVAGAIGIIGPMRMLYRHLFGIIKQVADTISSSLTSHLQKYKITFREPRAVTMSLEYQKYEAIPQTKRLLLEKKGKKHGSR